MKRNIILGIVILVVGVGLALVSNYAGTPREAAPQTVPQATSISLSVDGLYAARQVSIATGETILEVLQSLDTSDPALKLTTKEYAGLGTLVTGMGGKENGTGKEYWQYKVNGVMPQIGASAYVLKNGDTVEWYFAASQA
jgi:hypothetical protein